MNGEATGERPRVLPLVGDRRRVLLDVLAEADGPVLLSFGSKVLGKAGSVMVGEVLDQVLGETGGPVLVTPEPHPSSRARSLKDAQAKDREGPAVLIATDGSEVALRAGEYAARLAGGLGAKLFVLYVVDEHQAFHAGVHYGQFVGMLSQEGREATGRVRALAEEAGIECEEFVVFGRPQQAILAAAEELEAEPIVLGAEGMSRLQHAFVGSVSEEVLRNANRTVVVVGGHPTGGPDGSPGAER